MYDERDRNDDPRVGLMHDLDLPRGHERELVVDRDRTYELNGEDSAVWRHEQGGEPGLRRVHEGQLRAACGRSHVLSRPPRARAASGRGQRPDGRAERRVKASQQKLDRLDEALLYSESIDLIRYSRQSDRLREELTFAKIDRRTEAVLTNST